MPWLISIYVLDGNKENLNGFLRCQWFLFWSGQFTGTEFIPDKGQKKHVMTQDMIFMLAQLFPEDNLSNNDERI